MQAILPSAIAVLGTLLGAALTGALQRWTTSRANEVATTEKRRDEFARAVGTFASAAMLLRRAEHDRAKKRLEHLEDREREDARQETYKLRTEARSAYYAVQLFADPSRDEELLRDAEQAMAMARKPNDAQSFAELEYTSDETRRAIDKVVAAANIRLRGWSPSR